MNTKKSKVENSLGQKIRFARIQKGMRQYELADNINVSANYISLIEGGKKTPSLSTIHRIATQLDVSVGFLLAEDKIIDDLKELAKRYDVHTIADGLQRLLISMEN